MSDELPVEAGSDPLRSIGQMATEYERGAEKRGEEIHAANYRNIHTAIENLREEHTFWLVYLYRFEPEQESGLLWTTVGLVEEREAWQEWWKRVLEGEIELPELYQDEGWWCSDRPVGFGLYGPAEDDGLRADGGTERSWEDVEECTPEVEPEFVGVASVLVGDVCTAPVGPNPSNAEECGEYATHTAVYADAFGIEAVARCDEHGKPGQAPNDREWSGSRAQESDKETGGDSEDELPIRCEWEVGVQKRGDPDSWQFFHPRAKSEAEARRRARSEARDQGWTDPGVYQIAGPWRPNDPTQVGREIIEEVFDR